MNDVTKPGTDGPPNPPRNLLPAPRREQLPALADTGLTRPGATREPLSPDEYAPYLNPFAEAWKKRPTGGRPAVSAGDLGRRLAEIEARLADPASFENGDTLAELALEILGPDSPITEAWGGNLSAEQRREIARLEWERLLPLWLRAVRREMRRQGHKPHNTTKRDPGGPAA